jgi:hypothetical protein
MSKFWIILLGAKVHLAANGKAHRARTDWSLDVKYLIRIALTAASLASIHPVTRGDTLDLSPPALQQAAFAAAQSN